MLDELRMQWFFQEARHVCREDLDENLVYTLTKTLFDALPDLVQTHVAAKAVSVEGGPATPLPLHPGAARFYRERELLQ